MRRLMFPFLLAAGLFAALTFSVSARGNPPTDETRQQIEAALAEAVERSAPFGLAYVVYEVGIDELRLSKDGALAVLWLAALDRQTGLPVGMEPWLGLARNDGAGWQVSLPSDPEFSALFTALPQDLMPASERAYWQDGLTLVCDTSAIGPFTGYKLPWTGGQTLLLTQSIYHTLGWGSGYNPTFSMIHAFDFSTSPSGLFNVWAARPGTVKYFYDSQPNNDPTSPGNYIVLQDTGTSPTSYQLYLHLAQGSIPAALKSVGAPVQQGQVIGVADDTGASTNHHLHFQVHTEVSWWGCSVDVRFSDVAINGGRPRLPLEAQTNPEYGSQGQTAYISGNTAPPSSASLPGGGILSPSTGQTINQSLINLSGYAFDYDSGVVQAQFAYNADGSWTPIGSVYSFSGVPGMVYFNGSLDACAAGIPDGPVILGVKATDESGNVLSGGLAVPVILNANCTPAPPPPACQPDADEVALFAEANYAGTCFILPVGEHVQTFSARSLLVGGDASITLYFSDQLRARSQTFTADDPNLSDDRASLEQFASARVRLQSQAPGVPVPAWPGAGQALPVETSFSLVWHDGGGSQEFQVRLTGTGVVTSPWSGNLFWDPGPLAAGAYIWEVRARNAAGESAWSAPGTFTVDPPDPGAGGSPVSAPLDEDFEAGAGGWYGSGLWNLLDDGSAAFNGSHAWWYGQPAGDFASGDYNTGSPNAGSLTSPPIFIPGPGYSLRYHSRYDTESAGVHWDRRRVLVSANGGPFVELYQLSEDLPDDWGRSPFFSLNAYAGQTIRVRFAFETMDAQFNDGRGWLIDGITIDTAAPPACTAAFEPNNTPAQAAPLAPGVAANAELCPDGDLDFFKFTGSEGDRLQLDIDARVNGSLLDAYIFLLDADGSSILAENDDESPGVLLDSLLHFTIPADGLYYVKVRSYDHPGPGSNAYFYKLTMTADATDPVVSSLTPSVPLVDINSLPASVTLTAAATDSGSGLASVEFFYHSFNWGADDWQSLGVDANGTDGWKAVWSPAVHPAHTGMALLALATDQAGNVAALGLWNLFPLPEAVYLPLGTR